MSADDDIHRYHESMLLKNQGTATAFAVILGIFGILGVGHMYIGKVAKGIGYLLLGFVLLGLSIGSMAFMSPFFGITVFVIAYIIVFVFQILGVRSLCREFNEYFVRTKKELW